MDVLLAFQYKHTACVKPHDACTHNQCLAFFENAETHEAAMRLGTMLDFCVMCQNHQLKQSIKAKGPGHFPYLICHPLCVAQDNAYVPLCCVPLWGISIAAVLLQY